jgi:hypothetical protein
MSAFTFWIIIYPTGFILYMIVVVAMYYVNPSKKEKSMSHHLLIDGKAQYSLFWPICIPVHLIMTLILKAGQWLAVKLMGKTIVLKIGKGLDTRDD